MKALRILTTILVASFFCMGVYAQGTKTESFKVKGNCDMCKERIEKAAKISGVTKAEWSTKTQLLAITYDPKKTSSEAVLKKVAAAGHDNEKAKAEDKAYNSLPECCKYDRKK